MNLKQNKGHIQFKSLSVVAFIMWAAGLYATVWGLVWGMSLLTRQSGSQVDTTALKCILQLLCMTGLAMWIAASRLCKNPFTFKDKKYLQMLALSPWQYGTPMPVGSCFYTVGDLIKTLTLITLGIWQLHYQANIAQTQGVYDWLIHHGWNMFQIACLIDMIILALLFMFNQVLNGDWETHEWQLLLLLLPMPVFLHAHVYALPITILLIYILCAHVLRRNLKQLHERWPYWGNQAVEELRKEARKSNLILGSLKTLAPNLPIKMPTLRTKLIVALLITWWFHAFVILGYLVGDDYPYDREGMYWITSIVAIIFGCGNVVRFIASSPINSYARPLTGQWFIKRFDLILVMPTLLILTAWGMTWLFTHNKISPPVYLYGLAVAITLIHHLTSPSNEAWHYTWRHSDAPGKQPEIKNKKNNSTEIRITIS
ncbi:MAG: hypothetical protein ACF8OB_07355 [Phycisphaeraceae bacterium JB051]